MTCGDRAWVAILEDDVRRLAAEFQRHTFHRLCGSRVTTNAQNGGVRFASGGEIRGKEPSSSNESGASG
jgi:hypothetical protein